MLHLLDKRNLLTSVMYVMLIVSIALAAFSFAAPQNVTAQTILQPDACWAYFDRIDYFGCDSCDMLGQEFKIKYHCRQDVCGGYDPICTEYWSGCENSANCM